MSKSPWEAFLEQRLTGSTGPGVATLEQLKALSGLEFLQRIADGRLPRPPSPTR